MIGKIVRIKYRLFANTCMNKIISLYQLWIKNCEVYCC